MKHVGAQETGFDQDLEDCRQLAALIFEDAQVGTQTEVSYTPLKQHRADDFSRHFLRLMTHREDGEGRASIEVVEQFTRHSGERVRMGYSVDGSGGESRFDDDPFTRTLPLDWPTVVEAPRINDCIHNFRNAGEEREVDPEGLLKELLREGLPSRPSPHVAIREIDAVNIQGYDVSFTQRTHAMPSELSEAISMRYPVSEWMKLIAAYKGRVVLNIGMIFGPEQRLIGLSHDGPNVSPHEHVGALAGFKRSIFG